MRRRLPVKPVVRIKKERIMGLFSKNKKESKKMKWQKLEGEQYLNTFRCKVPGGWLITVRHHVSPYLGVTFMPDPEHSWDGCSLE